MTASDIDLTGRAASSGYYIQHVRPRGYLHAEALTELALTCHFGLRRLGALAARGEAEPRGRAIVFGAHLIGESSPPFAEDAILFNTEQIEAGSPWMGSAYLELLRRHIVWDYSERNAERLRGLGVPRARCVPVGYVPELVRIAPATEDTDVLFYGSLNERRQRVLADLKQRGLKVVHLFGVYGAERDQAIARAKVVLNIHFYESKIFEIVRVAYLLSNFRPVVAECGPQTEIEPRLKDAVHCVEYGQLADACATLVNDEAGRRALAARGHAVFARRRAEDELALALGLPPPLPEPSLLPRVLHVGSGKDFRVDWLNVDVNPAWAPDATLDIAAVDFVGTRVATRRFGDLTIPEGYFETLIANDVLEHIPNLVAAMTNMLRLLRPGGTLQVLVPYDLSHGAWQDPTHVRAFNEKSWPYYTDWHWYLGWTEARFDTIRIEYQPSALGEQMLSAGDPLEEILRTPRAVDSMRVVLRKRYLQDRERVAALARQPGIHAGKGATPTTH